MGSDGMENDSGAGNLKNYRILRKKNYEDRDRVRNLNDNI